MPRTNYTLPVDVVRLFDPQITQENLENWSSAPEEALIANEDADQIRSRIRAFESKWDREATPMREVAVVDDPGYIYKSAKGRGFPVHVYLDHRHVVPFDATQGDVIERRTGRNSWTDITAEEGNSWVADYRKGKLTLFRLPGFGHLPVLRRWKERFVRLRYRIRGAATDVHTSGQTTLSNDITDSQTGPVDVADAAKLPAGGGPMLVGGDEYVQVGSVDAGADTIEVATRGIRASTATSHDSGAVVHYCPPQVRDAVAAKTARWLVLNADWTDALVDTGSGAPQPQSKLDDWEREWNETVARYSDRYGYK